MMAMLEELSRRLGPQRKLREPEMELLRRLIMQSGKTAELKELPGLAVQEVPDGGMGSLYLVSVMKAPEQRRFGSCVADLQFDDADGVPIIAALHVDKEGRLYELDIWQVDYSPVIALNPGAARPV